MSRFAVERKDSMVAIRCNEKTKARFKEICGHFKSNEDALNYLMGKFNEWDLKVNRGRLL